MTVTLHDGIRAVSVANLGARLQRARISAQTHRAALGRDTFLLLHEVDHGILRLLHFARVSVLDAQHVARELDHGALHAQTYSEEGHLVFAGIAHRLDLALYASIAEARGHQDTRHAAQRLAHVLGGDLLRIDVREFHLAVVGRAGVDERLADRLVGVGQLGILAHQRDLHSARGMLDLLHETAPRIHIRLVVALNAEFGQQYLVQMLFVHAQGHFVNRRHVDRLHHGVGGHVAEQRHLATHLGRERMFGAQHQHVGLQTRRLQLLDRVLRGFGLKLARSGHVGDERQMDQHRILVA